MPAAPVVLTRVAAAVLALLASGCAPVGAWMRVPINGGQLTAPLSANIEIGDVVRVSTKERKAYVFKVVSVSANGFVGLASTGKKYELYYNDMAGLHVKRLQWVTLGW